MEEVRSRGEPLFVGNYRMTVERSFAPPLSNQEYTFSTGSAATVAAGSRAPEEKANDAREAERYPERALRTE